MSAFDYVTALGAWYDKEGSLHWPTDDTGYVTPPRCSSCGEREHGSAACRPVPEELPPPTYYWPWERLTLRVMDDRLFVVEPGAPPDCGGKP